MPIKRKKYERSPYQREDFTDRENEYSNQLAKSDRYVASVNRAIRDKDADGLYKEQHKGKPTIEPDVQKILEEKMLRSGSGPSQYKGRALGRANKHRRRTNPLKDIKVVLKQSVADTMSDMADAIVETSKQVLLTQHGESDLWTGELESSIYRGPVEINGNKISVSFYADAKNQDNGAMYAQFLEQGTGDKGTGEGDKKWPFKDSNGKWHTTSGQAPTPFLEEPIEKATPILEQMIGATVTNAFNVAWYEGSQQLWKQEKSKEHLALRIHL